MHLKILILYFDEFISITILFTVSILTFVIIAILMISELRYYLNTKMKYEYDVDGDIASKLDINIDITVAMKCDCKY